MTTHGISIPVLSALLALAASGGVPGQPSPPYGKTGAPSRASFPDPALERLVSEALQQNGDVAASVATAEAAAFRIAPARTLPDPFLSFQYQNDGWAFSLGERDMTFLGAMVSQPFPWPGKLRLAGEEAEQRAAEIRSGTVERTRLAVEARVRRVYYDLLLARELLGLIEDRHRAWRDIVEVARQRYAVGLGMQQDLLRAQVELLRVEEGREDQNAQVAGRQTELNRLTGRPQDGPIATGQLLELRTEIPDLAALLAGTRDRSPELASLCRQIEAGRARAGLARKEFLPDFVASGGPMYRGGLEPMWQVGVGVTVPLRVGSRQKPLAEAADAELRAARSRLSSAALELELRTRERLQRLDAALRVARLYRDGVIPTDQLSLESAVANYRADRAPFLTVLEALNTLYADRALYLSRLADAEKWRVAIDEVDLQPTAGMSTGPAPTMGSPLPGAAGAMGVLPMR